MFNIAYGDSLHLVTSRPADVRDQPGVAGSGRFGVLKHIDG
jgi:hypothetical protein